MNRLTIKDIIAIILITLILGCAKYVIIERQHSLRDPTKYKNTIRIDTVGNMKIHYVKAKNDD